jgi:ferredoxin
MMLAVREGICRAEASDITQPMDVAQVILDDTRAAEDRFVRADRFGREMMIEMIRDYRGEAETDAELADAILEAFHVCPREDEDDPAVEAFRRDG